MTGRRLIIAAAVVLVAVLLQLCAVDELPLPLGIPDLPLLGVVALALAWGSSWGASCGFATGLVLDLAPPADHAVGRLALVYSVIGYVVGWFEDAEQISVPATILTVVAGAVVLVGLDAVLTGLLGDGTVTTPIVGRLLVATVGYDVVLAPFVVPLLSRLARRADPAGAW